MPNKDRLLSSARIALPSALLAFEKSILLLNLLADPTSVVLPPSGRDFELIWLFLDNPPISMVGFCYTFSYVPLPSLSYIYVYPPTVLLKN